MISVLKNLFRLLWQPGIWSVLVTIPCAPDHLRTCVFSCFGVEYFINVRFGWFVVLFKSCIYLPTFCLLITESAFWSLQLLLKTLSPFNSVSVFFICTWALLFGSNMFIVVLSSWWMIWPFYQYLMTFVFNHFLL